MKLSYLNINYTVSCTIEGVKIKIKTKNLYNLLLMEWGKVILVASGNQNEN
tara:strand:- start:51 stop:203 length:153 start_codon:yes stop_codon:yes gene_type:complete